ncbi:unnamed protein product, partial [Alternaria alternata]
MGYITRSNLIVGEISRLEQVNKENTSYELSFIGTTLDCKTTNRSMESTILQLEHVTPADDSGKSWKIQHPEPVCVLTNNVDSGPWPGNTSITYRVAHYQDTLQYWPCLDKEQWIPAINGSGTMDTQYVDFPGAGIHVVVPITETVCYPKIVEYHVTISDALGAQHTSYVIKDDISMPVYTKYLENFDGNLTQFAQLSDALVIYRDFSMNLNQSGTGFVGNNFDGNLTQFAQLSDALVIHRDFSMNLNQSGTGFVGNNFDGNLTQFAQLSDALVIHRDFSMNLNQSGTGFVGNNFDGNLTQFAQLSDALVIHRDFSMNLNQSGTGFVGNNFDGNLTQFAQLSDALVIHRDFSMNLNQSGTGFVGNNFEYPSMSNET